MWKKKKPRYVTGSLTVEAVFVVPLVLFVVFALMYMSLYLHDVCVIKAKSERSLSEICRIKESGSPLSWSAYGGNNWLQKNLSMLEIYLTKNEKEKIKEAMKSEVEGQLYLFTINDYEFSQLFQTITLTTKAEADIPIPFIKTLLPRTDIQISSKADIHNPAVSVRYGKFIYTEFEKTTLHDKMDDLLKKAKEFLGTDEEKSEEGD